jgi:hypothetical protein
LIIDEKVLSYNTLIDNLPALAYPKLHLKDHQTILPSLKKSSLLIEKTAV